MNRVIFLLLAGAFWAVMMALLVQREVLPYLEFRDPPTYRSYLRTIREPEVSTQSILMSGSPAGSIETLVFPKEDGSAEIRTWIKFDAPDAPSKDRTLWMASRTRVDSDQRLLRYDARAMQGGIPITLSAVRNGDKARMEVRALIFHRIWEVPFDNDAILSDGFLPYFGGRLAVGKKWRVKNLDWKQFGGGDPNRVATSDLFATVEERKTVQIQGKPMVCYEIVFRRAPTRDEDAISHIVYVNESGVVVATTLFFGKFVFDVRLSEKRSLTRMEAESYRPSMRFPAGFAEP